METHILRNLAAFRDNNITKIDIFSNDYLNKTYLYGTSLTFISDAIKEDSIKTGKFLFGFKCSLLFFENGFYSRNTRKLYPYNELRNCSFLKKGKLIKINRLTISRLGNEESLDFMPYKSNLDQDLLLSLQTQILEAREIDNSDHPDNKTVLNSGYTKICSNRRVVDQKKGEVAEIEEVINSLNEKTKKKRLSLKLESNLSLLPNQGIGSIKFYNTLVQKKDKYDSLQFNNIVRFLSHIEGIETNYRLLLEESHKKYLKSPEDECFNNVLNVYNNLNLLYAISDVLIDNVDKDVVQFSKAYNKLEDEGMFMSGVERMNFETLSSISKNVANLNETVINGFSLTHSILENIDYSLSDIAFTSESIKDSLWMKNE